MRNLNSMRASNRAPCTSIILQKIKQARHVREPFSDVDILDLQDAFLNNGLHYIKVDDTRSGRSLIKLFLDSLQYYHNVTCLTMATEPLDCSATDLYGELMVGGYLDGESPHRLEEYLLEEFYHDFMWLEASHELINSHWFSEFFKQITQFKLDKIIPILVIAYK